MGRDIVRRTACLLGTIVVLTVLMLPLFAVAQRPVQVRRIAFLELAFPPAPAEPTPFLDAFREGLRARGWTDGTHPRH